MRIIDNVVVNSEELKDYLVSRRNIEENKVNVIYHFSNEPEIPKPSIINKEIMYAGNLGTPQNIESFINIFSENTNKLLITNLEEIGFGISKKIQKTTGKFSGKTFVMTGTLSNYTRQNATKIIEDMGGIVTTTVSKNTDYLLFGKNPGSKYEKAQNLKVRLISEKDFVELTNK